MAIASKPCRAVIVTWCSVAASGFKGGRSPKAALDARTGSAVGDPTTSGTPSPRISTKATPRRPGKAYSFARPHVTEAITNHLSGHKSGIGGKYNHAKLQRGEKREALDLWGKHIGR